MNSPERSPPIPARIPATLRSWQGEPNVMKSTGSIVAPFSFVMSPRCFICGKFLVVTAIGNGSISLAHTGIKPFRLPARGQVPAPSKRLPIFKSSLQSVTMTVFFDHCLFFVFQMLFAEIGIRTGSSRKRVIEKVVFAINLFPYPHHILYRFRKHKGSEDVCDNTLFFVGRDFRFSFHSLPP